MLDNFKLDMVKAPLSLHDASKKEDPTMNHARFYGQAAVMSPGTVELKRLGKFLVERENPQLSQHNSCHPAPSLQCRNEFKNPKPLNKIPVKTPGSQVLNPRTPRDLKL